MSIEVKGLDALLKDLKSKPAEVQKIVDDELTDGAKAIEERAALLAPVDRGLLRGNIIADVSIPLNKRVVAKTFYAAYLEFGTKSKFKGNGRDNIAKQFQGKSGKTGDMVKNIYEWLKRKGYFPPEARSQTAKQSYARFVAMRIAKFGIEPANEGKGYFFRAYDELLPAIIANIKKKLNV